MHFPLSICFSDHLAWCSRVLQIRRKYCPLSVKSLIFFATGFALLFVNISWLNQRSLGQGGRHKSKGGLTDLSEFMGNGSAKRDYRALHNRNVKLSSVCTDESCRSDYVRHLQTENVFPIPAIRHILWKNESVSEYFAEQLRSWQRIHPDWTYVLWRDQDLEPFVATHFPGLLEKFKSLPNHIMRVDMIRYMILFKYGGIYADLDYSLVNSLDRFRRFHAVVTREPDAHSLQYYGMSWPVKPMANPAFMMSAPGHIFYHFVMLRLESRDAHSYLSYAGPYGLTDIIENYQRLFPITNNVKEAVYVPPSYSFYPYPDNRLSNSKSAYLGQRFDMLRNACKSLMSSNEVSRVRLARNQNLSQYCTDVNNMDSITDKSQPMIAIHDMKKPGAVYDGVGTKLYSEKLTDVRRVIDHLILGKDF